MKPGTRIRPLIIAGVAALHVATGPASADLLVEEQFIYTSGANINGQSGV